MRRAPGTAAVLLAAALVAACRPAIGDLQSAGPGASSGASSPSAEPAAKLQPDQPVSVQIQLLRGFGPADAALQYAQALDIFRPVNLTVNLAPPIAGYDPFAVQPARGVITVWIGSLADVAPAVAKGLSLEAVGELTGRDATVLVQKGRTPVQLASLAGKTVVADTTASAASFRAALAQAGVAPESVKIALPDDPAAPFDPTAVLDGSAAGAVVSVYDGWARIQEAAFAAGLDPSAYRAQPLRDAGQEILGELVWVQPHDLADPQLKAAVAALLATIGTAQVECRDAVEDCAGAAAAQSDRTQGGIAWSIDQLDRLLFPSKDGIIHTDPTAWARTVAAMQAARVAGVPNLTMTDGIIDLVVAALRSQVDLYGTTWKPHADLRLLPSPAP